MRRYTMRLKNYEEPKAIRTKFYYVRAQDESKFPVVTICLKHDPLRGIITRGIAVCAMNIEKEQRRKKKAGRGIAETRAKWSMINYRRNLAIKTEALEKMDSAAIRFIALNHIAWMCDHDPILTDHERKILRLEDAPLSSCRVEYSREKEFFSPKIDPVYGRWYNRLYNWIGNKLLWSGKGSM
jgi:hypothetical protein